jgi:hypothetical protein
VSIDLLDVRRAQAWMFDAERLMPDIFRAMQGRSDQSIIEELHIYVSNVWRVNQRPIHESLLVKFLSDRAPSEKVKHLLEIAERGGQVSRQAGTDMYLPKAKGRPGVE